MGAVFQAEERGDGGLRGQLGPCGVRGVELEGMGEHLPSGYKVPGAA
jgi:hypothetical protein